LHVEPCQLQGECGGALLYALGSNVEAEQSFRRAVELNPGDQGAWNNLGNALSAQNKFDEALAMERQSLMLRPDNAAAYMNIGEINLERGNLQLAVQAFEQAIRILPTTEAHTNLANAYGQLGRLDDAVVQYQNALALNPRNRKAASMLQRTQGYIRQTHGGAATQTGEP
jgi:superkiller protein 3